MDSWDCVQTEFMGDETTNFGPRIENGTALYQVDTLATISPKSQVGDPPVQAFVFLMTLK